jgi:ribulose-phosphate 3-epimerase
MCRLAPSILSADFNRLGEQIQILQDNHIEVLHIDVMDGAFVPSISFGMPVISSIRKESRLFFDVHLMVQEPARYFEEFVRCGADSITFHVEACQDPEATLTKLKGYPVKTAVSIKPGTEIAAIEPYLPQVDMVLVMGVEPGFGGQALIPSTLDKLSKLDAMRRERGLSYLLEIDGGVNFSNISQVVRCGADIIVAGTAVFRGDIQSNIHQLKEEISGAS